MNAPPTTLQAAENDLKHLMAEVTRTIEKAQQAVARISEQIRSEQRRQEQQQRDAHRRQLDERDQQQQQQKELQQALPAQCGGGH